VDLGDTPLYVRAGVVLPTSPPRQYTTEPADDPLTLTVFSGADGVSFLYQDDGDSFDFRNGEFMRIEMQWEDAARKLAIRLASGARLLRANTITLSIKAVDSKQSKTVTFKGDPLSVAL
jgi:alpha-glucosidase (family GH31 glycosyl hydrolase)